MCSDAGLPRVGYKADKRMLLCHCDDGQVVRGNATRSARPLVASPVERHPSSWAPGPYAWNLWGKQQTPRPAASRRWCNAAGVSNIGRLLSQTATICLFVFKLFPCSKQYETLWTYQTRCIYSCGLITPTKICIRNVIWCLSHQWSREGKLWRPITRKLLNGTEIWFHIRVELFQICM